MPHRLDLALAPDELGEAAPGRPLQACPHWSEPRDLEQFDRLADAFDPGRAKSFELKIALDQSSHISANYGRTGRGEGLKPRSETGRVSNRAIFGLLGASLDGTHHHFADVDADPHLQVKP